MTGSVTLANTATADATYTETLSSNGFSSTTSGFTATGSVSGIAGGSSGSGTLTVGIGSGVGSGSKSGSTTLALQTNAVNSSGLGTASVGDQVITITGTGYRAAVGSVSSSSVNLGNFRVGATNVTGSTTVSNTATADSYSEGLTLSASGATGGATSSGLSGLIAAGGDKSITVGLSSVSSAGANNGSFTLGYTTDGTGTSGLSSASAGSQVINVTAYGYNAAAAAATQTVDLGAFRVGTGVTGSVTLANTATADATYTETLSSNGFSSTTSGFTATGSVSGIAGGSSGSGTLTVGIGSGVGSGSKSGSTTLALQTNAVNSSGLGTASVGNQVITITGVGYNLADGSVSTTSVDLGLVRKGGSLGTSNIGVTNGLSSGTYNETLGATFANASGVSASGSVTGLYGSDTSSLTVGLGGTSTAGVKTGTVDVVLKSQAVNSSGLSDYTLSTHTITVTGTVYSGDMKWSSGSGSWSTNANWSDNQAAGVHYIPGVDTNYNGVDAATFSGTGGTVTLSGANANLNAITFGGTHAYTIAKGTGNGTLTLAGSGASISAISDHNVISADVTLGADLDASVAFTHHLTVSGIVSGDYALTKSDRGTLILSAANTYTGGTSVNAGTLTIENVAALGTGTVTVYGGFLDLNQLDPTNTINLAGGKLLRFGQWQGAQVNVVGNVGADSLNNLAGVAAIVKDTAVVDLDGVTKDLIYEGGTLNNLTSFAGSITVTKGTLDLSSGANTGTLELRDGGKVDFGSNASAKTIVYTGGTVAGSAYTGNVEVSGSVNLTSAIGSGKVVVTQGNAANVQAGFSKDVAISYQGGSLTGLENYSGTVTLEGNSTFSTTGTTTTADVIVTSGSTLKGTGAVGAVVQEAGSIIAPGNSPGIATYDSLVVAGGSGMQVEFYSATSARGLGGYDAVNTGVLDLSALTTSNRYILELISLVELPSTHGNLADFDASLSYTWELFQYATLLLPASYNGNLTTYFTFSTSQFKDYQGKSVSSSSFSIVDADGTLQLIYAPAIPEPSTYGLMLGGLALACVAIRRRRKA